MNQLINRRQALSLFGVAGVASLTEFRRGSQAWAAACATTTPNDLGPYFVDEIGMGRRMVVVGRHARRRRLRPVRLWVLIAAL